MNGCLLGRVLLLGIAVASSVSTPNAAAQSVREGRTAQDRRYIAGGIGLDESEQMKAMSRDFALSLTVAAKSCAYLADTQNKIRDATGRVVLDTQMDSPYLLVDLAPGKYSVEATFQGKSQRRNVDLSANLPTKIAFGFDVPTDREPAPKN
jgi:hypothetical protein